MAKSSTRRTQVFSRTLIILIFLVSAISAYQLHVKNRIYEAYKNTPACVLNPRDKDISDQCRQSTFLRVKEFVSSGDKNDPSKYGINFVMPNKSSQIVYLRYKESWIKIKALQPEELPAELWHNKVIRISLFGREGVTTQDDPGYQATEAWSGFAVTFFTLVLIFIFVVILVVISTLFKMFFKHKRSGLAD